MFHVLPNKNHLETDKRVSLLLPMVAPHCRCRRRETLGSLLTTRRAAPHVSDHERSDLPSHLFQELCFDVHSSQTLGCHGPSDHVMGNLCGGVRRGDSYAKTAMRSYRGSYRAAESHQRYLLKHRDCHWWCEGACQSCVVPGLVDLFCSRQNIHDWRALPPKMGMPTDADPLQ